MVDDGRTDDGPWLYYKLTNEPEGSGELTVKKYIRHPLNWKWTRPVNKGGIFH